MKKLAFALVVALLFTTLVSRADMSGGRSGAASPKGTAASPRSAAPSALAANETIETYCVDCHNKDMKAGGHSFEGFDVARAADDPAVAER